MYYKEHEPGHFHAEHQGQQGKFDFSGEMTIGIQSRTALGLIRKWAVWHQAELQTNWEQMKAGSRSTALHRLSEVPPMDFLQSVIRAEYEGGFRIHFTFSDNVRGTIDLQDWFEGPIFEPLKDRTYFQRFSINGGTVVWPNGADIAPETLYETVKIAGAAQRAGADGAVTR